MVSPGAPAASFATSIPPSGDPALSRGVLVAQQQLLSTVRRAPLTDAGCLATRAPPGVSTNVWLFEHLRLLICELNDLVGRLAPVCSHASCPVMGTAEFTYLCASHPTPHECDALAYSVHTLDGAAGTLASSRTFPSRLDVSDTAAGAFPSLARRLYRVLSHAWRHHPAVFVVFEAETRCGARLTALAHAYSLLSEEQLLIPEAELWRPVPAEAAPARDDGALGQQQQPRHPRQVEQEDQQQHALTAPPAAPQRDGRGGREREQGDGSFALSTSAATS